METVRPCDIENMLARRRRYKNSRLISKTRSKVNGRGRVQLYVYTDEEENKKKRTYDSALHTAVKLFLNCCFFTHN